MHRSERTYDREDRQSQCDLDHAVPRKSAKRLRPDS
jgi:hypothetical protein